MTEAIVVVGFVEAVIGIGFGSVGTAAEIAMDIDTAVAAGTEAAVGTDVET